MMLRNGFTLIESLVVLALAAVLATLAGPSFRSLLMDARLAARQSELVHAVHLAKAQALVRGEDVVLCPSRDAVHCEAEWSSGFLVTVAPASTAAARLATPEAPIMAVAPSARTALAANRDAFVFRPAGLRSVNGTFTLCDRRGAGHARQVVVSYTGRARVAAAGEGAASIECAVAAGAR